MKRRENQLNKPKKSNKRPVSPQTMEVLKYMFTTNRAVSARRIATDLGLLRPVVHRSLNSLHELGLIEKHIIRPNAKQTAFYRVSRYPYARRRFLIKAEEDFNQRFGGFLRKSPNDPHDWQLFQV